MVKRLNLTRNQFASFLKDFEQIRQFELLFAEVNKLVDASDAENLAALAPPLVDQVVTNIQTLIETVDPTTREDNSVKTDYIDLNTTAPAPFAKPARLWWDDGEKTAVMTLGGGNVTLHMGQEEYQDCYNGTGALLAKGVVVQVTGAQGQRLQVAKAQANAEATSVHTLGFTTEAIASGAEGFVTNSGLIRGINTTVDSEGNALTAGDTLYLSTTVAGGFTRVKPSAPNHLVIVGFVVRVHASSGSIFVKVDNGYEIDELHNVKVTAPVSDGSLLFYDAALGYWKNLLLTVNATASDVLNVSGNEIGANDGTADSELVTEAGDNIVQEDGGLIMVDGAFIDAIVFWDDSAGKLTYLTLGPNLGITGTTLDLADMPEERIKGRAIGAGTGSPQDLTGTQATAILDTFTSTLKGLAPASGGGTSNYLRADGTWQAPPGTQDPVTIATSAADVLSVTGQALGGVDAGAADRIVFWDDSANKLTYLAPSAPIRITGTNLEHATSGVSAATYGSATQVAQISVNAEGHVTSASNVTISGVTPSAHASTHQHGGSDEVATATAAANAIPKAGAGGQLAAGWMPAFGGDVTTTAGSTTTTIASNAVTLGKIQTINTDRLLGRDSAGGGNVEQLTVSGGIEFTDLGGIQTSAFTGDVTKSAGGTSTTIANDAVTYAKIQNVSANSVLARADATSGDVGEVAISASQLLGRGSTGNVAAITLGSNLSMSGTTLNATGGGSVTIGASAADVLSVAGSQIDGVDPNADRIVFWDDSAGKLTYLAPSSPIQITTTNLEHATSGVTAATYGGSTQVAQVAVNAQGHVTSASNVTISGVTPGGSAGGDLTGTYPNPTITAGVVDNIKLADMPANTIKGNNTGLPADPIDLTTAQATAMLDTFTLSLKGLAPASGGGTINYLRADGTWQAPPGTQDPVTIATSAADVLSVTGQAIGGVDINADRMVFWDDSAGKLTYLTPGTNLSISGTSLNASVPSIPNNFGTIAVTGQSNVVADSTSDTLTLAASNMVAITTNAATDTVTINVPLLSGDVTTTSAGVATISANAVDTTELNNQAVTYSKFQNVTGPKFIGRQTASSGSVTDLDMATARSMIGTANTTTTGLVPVLPNVVTSFLNGQGTFSSPIGTGGLIAVTVYDTSSGGTYQTFSTINSATKTMLVELVGGGGGGRSATAAAGQVVAGGGGAAGGYAYWFGARVVGATYSYMVGGGGGADTNGTDSNFRQDPSTVLATAKGGNPGGAAMASGTAAATGVGGDGGTGGTGTKSYAGAGGGGALRLSGTVGLSGYGASSIFGGGGKSVAAGTAGVAGGAPGAGGSGGCSNSATPQAGGAGSAGMVRIWEFY